MAHRDEIDMLDSIDFRFLKPSQKELLETKTKLLKTFEETVGLTSEGERPLNIILIGLPGAGKSSLINTFIASLSDTYNDYLTVGSYADGKAMTVFLNSVKASERYRKGCGDLCLPTFIDLAGINDEDTELWEELIRIVLYGCLPKGHSLKEIEEYGREYGIEELQNKYRTVDSSLKVDRIVFVASAVEEIPKNLIRCVMNVAMPTGGEGSQGRRTIPIFGVLTKKDKTVEGERGTLKTEKEFCSQLGFTGAGQRFALLSSYCDDVDVGKKRLEHSLPEIDVPALKFLIQVCKTTLNVQEDKETYHEIIDRKTSTVIHEPKRRHVTQPRHNPQPQRSLHWNTELLLMYLLFGFVLILFAVAMNPVIKEEELKNACAYSTSVRGFEEKHAGLYSICQKKTEISKPVSRSSILLVWLIMIGIHYVFHFVDVSSLLVDFIMFCLTRANPDVLFYSL